MKSDYWLTHAALADLETIADYTLAQWGEQQMEVYTRELTDRCAWLSQNPKAGRPRKDIHPAYYCYPQGKHLVFYVLIPEGISIIGFPHQSMDVLSHFDL